MTPDELIQKKKQEKEEHEQYEQTLLSGEFKYEPKWLGEDAVDPVSKRPMPVNVEMLKYKPLRLPKTHGHEMATISFKSYDMDTLIRAAEFASRAAYYLGIPTSPVLAKKTQKRLYTVIKSPFAQAKTKQNFHRTTYHRELKAFDATPEVVDLWLSFVNKHALQGIQYSASVLTFESVDFNKELDALTGESATLPNAYADGEDAVAEKVQELLKSDAFQEVLKK